MRAVLGPRWTEQKTAFCSGTHSTGMQHLGENFKVSRRGFPINVKEMLQIWSDEQKQLLDLKTGGKIDVLVGTHMMPVEIGEI